MLQLEINSQPITIKADRFKVVITGKQVKVVDANTREVTSIEAQAFKAPGSPDTLPFEWLPDKFDKPFLVALAAKNRLGLTTMQIAGSLASWVKKGHLINTKGVYTKTKVVSL